MIARTRPESESVEQDLFQTAVVAGENRLYHYQPLKLDYLEDFLLSNSVKFSNPAGFNDPWDCKPTFSKSILDDPAIYQQNVEYAIDLMRRRFGIDESELQRRRKVLNGDRNILEARIDELSEAMHEAILQDYRVYCMATRPDNFLMWAHYARSHSGVCLGFDTRSEMFCGALRVSYLASYPVIDFSSKDEAKLLHDTLLVKSEHWSYEEEFRVIAKEGSTEEFMSLRNGFAEIVPKTLTSITFGCYADGKMIEAVKEILRRRRSKPRLFQVRPAADEYRLTRQRMNC
jgi:hypothetical protein